MKEKGVKRFIVNGTIQEIRNFNDELVNLGYKPINGLDLEWNPTTIQNIVHSYDDLRFNLCGLNGFESLTQLPLSTKKSEILLKCGEFIKYINDKKYIKYECMKKNNLSMFVIIQKNGSLKFMCEKGFSKNGIIYSSKNISKEELVNYIKLINFGRTCGVYVNDILTLNKPTLSLYSWDIERIYERYLYLNNNGVQDIIDNEIKMVMTSIKK